MTVDPLVGFVYSTTLVASGSDGCTLPNEKTNGETTCPFWIVEMRYRLLTTYGKTAIDPGRQPVDHAICREWVLFYWLSLPFSAG